MSIFNDSEQELLDAAKYVLRDGIERLKTRPQLFPTTRRSRSAERIECAAAREALTLHLIAEYGSLRHEVAVVALIDAQGRLIGVEQFPQGKATHCEVHPRILAEKIVRTGTVAIVLAHNHPSGSNNPSQADIKMTDFFKDWVKPLDCELLEHFVLSPGDAGAIMGDF